MPRGLVPDPARARERLGEPLLSCRGKLRLRAPRTWTGSSGRSPHPDSPAAPSSSVLAGHRRDARDAPDAVCQHRPQAFIKRTPLKPSALVLVRAGRGRSWCAGTRQTGGQCRCRMRPIRSTRSSPACARPSKVLRRAPAAIKTLPGHHRGPRLRSQRARLGAEPHAAAIACRMRCPRSRLCRRPRRLWN